MKGTERQTPRSEQNPVKYKIDNFGVNVFVFVWVVSHAKALVVQLANRKLSHVWMFDEEKKMKNNREFEYFPPEFVLIVRKELKGKLQTRELFKFFIYVVNEVMFLS